VHTEFDGFLVPDVLTIWIFMIMLQIFLK